MIETTVPFETTLSGIRPLYIGPVTLTRWIWIFRSFIANGVLLTIISIPLLVQLSSTPREALGTRRTGTVFFPVGLFSLCVGILGNRILKDYREYIYSLNVDAGDSNVGAYTHLPELFRGQRPSRHSRQTSCVPNRLYIPCQLPPPSTGPSAPSTPYGPNEMNFVEILEPYASFQSLGIPPPPYRP